MTRNDWKAPPEPVPFPGQTEVHLWRVNLFCEHESHWRGTLSADEQQRADRYVFAPDRRRFSVTRAILRTILGRYVHSAPESLCFQFSKFGKPSLSPSQNSGGIQFSVAHSGDYSLLAFGLAIHLGVDVECLHVQRIVPDLAKAVLSPTEYLSFLALPNTEHERAFCDAWTRKEAIVKALGGGLSISLDSAEVEQARPPAWSVFNIEMDADYSAALAVKAQISDLRLWHWSSAGESASGPT
jgi:4'-phosphopantetheinyl transferase